MAIKKSQEAGDTISVELGTLGGEVRKYKFPAGTTVSEALEKAGFPADAEVRINGEPYEDGDTLEDGDEGTVMTGTKVKGA